MPDFEILLPALQGRQAGHDYYLVMCPLQLIPRLFQAEEGIEPDLRAQRGLNAGRVPEIANYIADHPDSYVLSALTGSIDRGVDFTPIASKSAIPGMGTLRIPLSARLLILDGIHRRAAIEAVLRQKPELGTETVSLVLFVDPELRRSPQLLSDLRRFGAQSSRSQGILNDTRDEMALLARELVNRIGPFRELTEMARSKISNRSLKLFTLSGIYHANKILLSEKRKESFPEKLLLSCRFWTEVAATIPDWGRAQRREVSPAELRKSYVHSHAIALAALGRAGRCLLQKPPERWRKSLSRLRSLDWSRSNTRLWEGRAMFAGRLSKSSASVMLTGNAIKLHLRLPLTPEEAEAEKRLKAR
jgi:DNA sulfur modification protein DndB